MIDNRRRARVPTRGRRAIARTAAPEVAAEEVVPPTGPVRSRRASPSAISPQALGVPVAQIIKIMMGLGKMVTITQSLSDESIELIAAELEPRGDDQACRRRGR